MRQNAVSSAPQKEAPTHRDETRATMPTVVEDCCSRRTPSTSVLCAAVGKIVRASLMTDAASSGLRSTRPATNRAISASGKIDSSRLYATIAARPVRPSSYALRQKETTARAARCTPPVYRVSEALGFLGDFRRLGRALGREHLGDPQAELLVDHDDLAAGDRLAVDQKVDGLAGQPVERHDRPGAERQRLADGHLRATDLDRELHRHVVQAGELLGRDGRRSSLLQRPGRGGLEGGVIDGFSHEFSLLDGEVGEQDVLDLYIGLLLEELYDLFFDLLAALLG